VSILGHSSEIPSHGYLEGHCRAQEQFFAWLALHDRVLTTDNMIIKNWPCNPICSLCSCLNETIRHLLTECNYTKAAWNLVAAKFNLPGYTNLMLVGNTVRWVREITRSGSRREKKLKLGILITFWWMVWKERNRNFFEVEELSAQALAGLIQDTINFHNQAWTSYPLD
jgi:hypothetical protein